MKLHLPVLFFFMLSSISMFGQSSADNEAPEKYSFQIQGDSRFTLIDRNSVGIWGLRLGVLFNEKIEFGAGIYSSTLFGIFDSSVSKDYEDRSLSPTQSFPSIIDFDYVSVYGEYRLIDKDRIVLTPNTQVGFGRVDVNFPNSNKERVREAKILIEHSIKADVKTTKWLRLIGGVGYRYLLAGEDQLKDTFNAPIYILGFSMNYSYIYRSLFKRNR